MAIKWNLKGQTDATCLYGEITVLATSPCIYYCGAKWHPSEPAGGYCGIQHHDGMDQPTIFSIWDTSQDHRANTTAADQQTIHRRFGGEGVGERTFWERAWIVGKPFLYFVQKRPSELPDSTDARYYFADGDDSNWRHVATITNPNAGHNCVTTIATNVMSFLENWRGYQVDVPKLALYRLWLGPTVDSLVCLTSVTGKDNWGKLADMIYLAEGAPDALSELFAKLAAQFGAPEFGGPGKSLSRISDRHVASEALAALRNLPSADKVGQ